VNHINGNRIKKALNIPANLKGKYVYHFTLLDNLESIIENGILCTNVKNKLGISHENIAEQGIQCRRHSMHVLCSNGKFVHDFVPFYFAKKTPMQLGVINKKNIDQPLILYFAIPIEIIEQRSGVVFTDASANTDIPPNFYDSFNLQKLSSLNWEAINSKKWGYPSESIRHQKMAELLIPDKIKIEDVAYIVVWNGGIKEEVEKIFMTKKTLPPQIQYDLDHYYTNFYDGGKQSIVTGPKFLNHYFEETIKIICKNTAGYVKYKNVTTALAAIQIDFSSIKELDDIDGLKANYGPHKDDVGTHSRKVANALVNYDEYNNLKQNDKDIVMLSAHLHDIGKGPKSRWPKEEMTKADNDHAVKSLPMLERILTEDIGNLDAESVRKIVMLVTFDDLVGDIVAKGRNKEQLFDIIKSENDLNMLIALGKSDMNSINAMWVFLNEHSIKELKANAIESLRCNNLC
jgi:hypothetical protein